MRFRKIHVFPVRRLPTATIVSKSNAHLSRHRACQLSPCAHARKPAKTTIEVAVVQSRSRVRDWLPPDTCPERQLDNLDHTMIGYRHPPLFTHEHGCVTWLTGSAVGNATAPTDACPSSSSHWRVRTPARFISERPRIDLG